MVLDLVKLKEKYNLNIKGIIHVGAHWGGEYKLYNDLNIPNMIFFEPLSNNFIQLQNNVRQSENVILVNKALGNMKGEVEMFVEYSNASMSSSILEPKQHLNQYPGIQFTGREMVKISTLDSEISDYTKYNFINIDVQGYELEVFKGSSNILQSIDYIISEVNRDELYKDCTQIDELDSYLSTFGFERVEIDWVGNTWGDAFYIKK
ncbi:MAG TPA: FkbM family methyltransferase [Caldisericia bacterium]|nr:FkbM family methyltransferase [Caldisericia bacterium]